MQLDSVKHIIAATPPSYDMVKLPPDITSLSSEQLAEVFTGLTGWADFFATQLANAQIREKTLEKLVDRKVASLTVEKMGQSTKADKVSLIKAQIALEPELQKLEDQLHEAYTQRKAWEVMLSNQERDISLVSREITRRTSDQRALRKDYL